jgi:hypothetical protein
MATRHGAGEKPMKFEIGLKDITIIPAQPGWSVLEAGTDGSGTPIVLNHCVIAWRLQTQIFEDKDNRGSMITIAEPITAEDNNLVDRDGIPGNPRTLKDPNGRIFDVGYRWYDGEVDWLAEQSKKG